jgi:hypothetical protein
MSSAPPRSHFLSPARATARTTWAVVSRGPCTALEQAGRPWAAEGEQPGAIVFLRDGDRIFDTYSSYARGGDLGNGDEASSELATY